MTTVTEPTAKRYSAGAAYDLAQVEDSQRTRARKVERTWRGEVTPERVERDHAEALGMDVAAAARKAAVRAVVARKAAMSAPTIAQPRVTRVFTFGYGHLDPTTFVPLAESYALVTAATPERCREVMFERYGNKWAFEYETLEAAARYPHMLRMHVAIDDTAPPIDPAVSARIDAALPQQPGVPDYELPRRTPGAAVEAMRAEVEAAHVEALADDEARAEALRAEYEATPRVSLSDLRQMLTAGGAR